jgi:hypothetical protein
MPHGERMWIEVQSAEVDIKGRHLMLTDDGFFEVYLKPVEVKQLVTSGVEK